MWWEYAIVAAVVAGAAAALIVRFRRTLSGRADCECGCQDACATLQSLQQELGEAGQTDSTDLPDCRGSKTACAQTPPDRG